MKPDRRQLEERRALLPVKENRTCGFEELPDWHYYARLKLEVAVAAENFWRKRGMTDPGAGGFGNFRFGTP